MKLVNITLGKVTAVMTVVFFVMLIINPSRKIEVDYLPFFEGEPAIYLPTGESCRIIKCVYGSCKIHFSDGAQINTKQINLGKNERN